MFQPIAQPLGIAWTDITELSRLSARRALDALLGDEEDDDVEDEGEEGDGRGEGADAGGEAGAGEPAEMGEETQDSRDGGESSGDRVQNEDVGDLVGGSGLAMRAVPPA